jgi:hypothetical protein
MTAAQAGGWWAAGLLAAILVIALIQHQLPHPAEPAPRDPRAAEPWMVDALPGIGPKRLGPVLVAIRAGELGCVPKPARGVAEQVFEQP